MREILFKAKTKMIVGTYNCGKDDGEWVIGHLYCDVGKWIIRQFEYDRADYVSYEVDPETICQYTGLTDKNGKKIWENDIVKFKHGGEFSENGIYFRNYVVEFINTYVTYGLRLRNKSIHFPFKQATASMHDTEVIGNVFDNPQLLV